MAIYHCSAKTISRSQGQTAGNAIAYEAGEKLKTPVGEVDFSKKDVLETAVIGTEDDLQTLADKMELAERRKNSCLGRRFTIALPEELNQSQQWEATKTFGEFLHQEYGVAVVANLHPPDRGGDQRNVHAHLTITDRRIDEKGDLGEKTRELSCMNKKLGENGVPRAKANLLKIREKWADIANNALDMAGHEETIDHRSNKERRIFAEPQAHLGKAKTEIKRKSERNQAKGEGRTYQISKDIQNELIKKEYGLTRKANKARTRGSETRPREEQEMARGDQSRTERMSAEERGDRLRETKVERTERRARGALNRIGGILERIEKSVSYSTRLKVDKKRKELEETAEAKRLKKSLDHPDRATAEEARETLLDRFEKRFTKAKSWDEGYTIKSVTAIIKDVRDEISFALRDRIERFAGGMKTARSLAEDAVPKTRHQKQEEELKKQIKKEQKRSRGMER